MNIKRTINFFLLLLFFFFVLPLPSHSENISAEVLNIKSDNNLLLLEMTKKYPQVKFSQYDDPPKILIELLDTNYHNNFKFDVPIKNNIITGLDFINDVSVGASRYEDDKYKVAIILYLKEKITLAPKLISTKDNIVSIAFLKKDIVQKPVVNKEINPPLDVKELYNNAVDEHLKGNLDKALSLYEKAITTDPGFYLAKFNLVKIFIDKQKYDQALNILQSILNEYKGQGNDSLVPKNLVFVCNIIGNIFYLEGELPKAEEYFNEAIKLDPSFAHGYYNLGLVFEQNKKISEAIESFKKVIELKSDFADAYYHLGVLNLILRDKKEAIAKFEKAIELAGDSVISELSKNELAKLKKPQKRWKKSS